MTHALISRTIEIDMGHRVPNHKSKCRRLHGHRYVITATVEGLISNDTGTSDEGMVMDYGDLKDIMMAIIHDPYDHRCMLFIDDMIMGDIDAEEADKKGIVFVGFIPTAENLARFWFERLQQHTQHLIDATIMSVSVMETPNSSASYPC